MWQTLTFLKWKEIKVKKQTSINYTESHANLKLFLIINSTECKNIFSLPGTINHSLRSSSHIANGNKQKTKRLFLICILEFYYNLSYSQKKVIFLNTNNLSTKYFTKYLHAPWFFFKFLIVLRYLRFSWNAFFQLKFQRNNLLNS